MQQYHRYLYGFVILPIASILCAEEAAFPTVDCVVSPSEIVELSAAVPGVVEHLHVERTHTVAKGQLLAELKADVEKASINLADARTKMTAELSAEQVNLKYDRIQSNRVNQLSEKKLASTQNLDEASRIKRVTYWRLKQAQEALKLRELELIRAKAHLEEKRVYSTIDGVVAERYKNEGEYVEDQPIFRLVQLNPLHINAVFPMEYYSRFQKGMSATIFPEVDQKQGYPAQVDLIDPLGDAASGTFGVRLVLDNSEYKLPAGLKCFLQVDTQQVAEAKPEPVLEQKSVKQETSISAPTVDETVDIKPADSEVIPAGPSDNINLADADASNNESAVGNLSSIPTKSGDDNSSPSTLEGNVEGHLEGNAEGNIDNSVEDKLSKSPQLSNQKLGPFASLEAVNGIQSKLDEQAIVYKRVTTATNVPKGYLVISSSEYKQPGSVLFAQFTDAGVKDMGRLAKNSYGGRISFGAYKGPVQADARKVKIAKLGVKAEVITRYKKVKQYWLNVAAIPQPLYEQLNTNPQD